MTRSEMTADSSREQIKSVTATVHLADGDHGKISLIGEQMPKVREESK